MITCFFSRLVVVTVRNVIEERLCFHKHVSRILSIHRGGGDRWISYIWTIYVEGMRSPTTATFIVFHGCSFHLFLFWKSSLHAVICKMSHAVLSYMSWLVTPCTRTYTWVRNITIWALALRIPSLCKTLPNILGFSIGLLGTISIIVVRASTNVTRHIYTLFLKDFLQVCLPNLL